MSPIDVAVDQLVAALRAYVTTVIEKPTLGKDVIEASNQVRAAGIAVEDAVAETAGWHIQLFLPDDEEDEDEDDFEDGRAVPSSGQGMAIRMRADFVVTDLDRLLAAGRAAYHAVWPDDPPEAAEQRIDRAEIAIGELLHRHLPNGLAGIFPTDAGLEDADSAVQVSAVDRVLAMDGLDDLPDDTFTLT